MTLKTIFPLESRSIITMQDAENIREAACAMDEARCCIAIMLRKKEGRGVISSQDRIIADAHEMLGPLVPKLHELADRLLGPLPD